jgi:hypothetical protein
VQSRLAARCRYHAQANLLCSALLCAAALKLYGMNVAPFAQYGRLLNSSVQFAAVEWEIVLGIWLLSGRRPIGAWAAAVLTFSAFAVVSGYFGVIGQATCGCFGAIQASPWVAFAVDITALGLLALARPDFRTLLQGSQGQWRRALVHEFGMAALAVAFCVGIVTLTSLVYGSTDTALARLRGESVSIRPGIADVGSGEPGQVLEATVEIVNRTERPVRVYGGTSDCSCIATNDLPLTLEPGEARQVSVKIRLPGSTGFFNRKAWLWTDCDDARTVLFGLTGRIDPPAQASVK